MANENIEHCLYVSFTIIIVARILPKSFTKTALTTADTQPELLHTAVSHEVLKLMRIKIV